MSTFVDIGTLHISEKSEKNLYNESFEHRIKLKRHNNYNFGLNLKS
mgnify:CR=1 FL=1